MTYIETAGIFEPESWPYNWGSHLWDNEPERLLATAAAYALQNDNKTTLIFSSSKMESLAKYHRVNYALELSKADSLVDFKSDPWKIRFRGGGRILFSYYSDSKTKCGCEGDFIALFSGDILLKNRERLSSILPILEGSPYGHMPIWYWMR